MINRQTVVERDGVRGVVIDDPMNLTEGKGVQVVWEDDPCVLGSFARERELKVIGPENAIAGKECMRGGGEDACIFFDVNGDGFSCQRFGDLRFRLMNRKDMSAKFRPSLMYPACKTERGKH